MKTILFLLISINCFGQELYEPITEQFENGLVVTSKWYNKFGVIGDGSNMIYPMLYFKHQKYYDYIEVRIIGISDKLGDRYIYIKTYKGNYEAPYIGKTEKGTLIFRLYFDRKAMWTGIDSGIKTIEFKTDKKWHKITINNNLTKLKNYGRN